MSRNSPWKIGGLVALLVFLLSLFANSFIQKKVDSLISNIEGLNVDAIGYSLITNSLSVDGIQFQTGPYNFRGTCQSIDVSGLDRIQYWKDGNIQISEVTIEQADLYFDIGKSEQNAEPEPKSDSDILLNDIVFRNGTIHILDNEKEITTIEGVHLRMQNLQLADSATWSLDDYFIRTGLISAILPGNLHQLNIESTDYNSEPASMTLSGLHFHTLISKEDWYEKAKSKQTHFDYKIETIELVKPDILSYINEKTLRVQKIVVNKSDLEIYEDKRFAHCDSCKKRLPQQNLLGSKSNIVIDSIQIKNSRLVYLSKELTKQKPGRFEFNKLYASIYHLSNIPDQIRRHSHMLVDAQANLFGYSPLKVHFDFDMTSASGAYTYSGNLGQFNLVELNGFLSPVKHVEIGAGVSKNISFAARANASQSNGTMDFNYQDLKVDFLNKNNQTKTLVTSLVNNLAVHRNNIPGQNFRTGTIFTVRDQSRSIFHNLSQSLQSGIRSSVLSKLLLSSELKPRTNNRKVKK